MATRMLKEHESHFEMHDGQSSFRVPKAGLSEALHDKIRRMAPQKMAEGGDVMALPPRREPEQTVYTEGGRGIVDTIMSPIDSWKDYSRRSALDGFGPAPVGQPEQSQTVAPPPQLPISPQMFAPGMGGGAPAAGPNPDDSAAQSMVDPAARARLKTSGLTKEAFDKAAAAANQKPTPETPKPHAPSMPGGYAVPADTSIKTNADAVKMAQQAEAAKGVIMEQEAINKAAALGAQQEQLQANAIQQKDMNDRAKDAATAAMNNVQAAREEAKKIDVSVDPGRFWASRSTGERIVGIIGLALGAIGTGPDGINRAAALLNNAVDRDLDAQKAEHEMRLKKGQTDIDAAQNIYSMSRQATQDESAAWYAAKATARDIAENKLQQIAATAAGPMAKANAQALSARLLGEKAEFDGKAHARISEERYQQDASKRGWAGLGIEQTKAAGGGLNKDAAKMLTDVEGFSQVIQKSGEKLKNLVKAYGTMEMTGPQEVQMKQLVSDIAVAQAKLNDPNSAAREAEVSLEMNNIFEPGTMMTSNDSALSQIQSYLDNSKDRRDIAYNVRGLPSPPK